MKKIEIYIREVNCDDDFKPIEDKRFVVTTTLSTYDAEHYNEAMPHVLDDTWTDIKKYFLRNRHAIPFRKLRRDDEKVFKD